MFRLVLRGIRAHKLRLALSGVAVVLGVSFVVGAFVLTDTLQATFDKLFGDITRGVSVTVEGKEGFSQDSRRAPVPATVLDVIRKVPGVARAEGETQGDATLSGCPRNGEAKRTTDCGPAAKALHNGSGPSLGLSGHIGSPLSPLTLASGSPPQTDHEVAVDAGTAKRADIRLGDQLTATLKDGPQVVTVTAIVRFGTTDSLAGATLVVFDPDAAQRLLGEPGEYDTITVAAGGGVSDAVLATRVRAAVPRDLEILTGAESAAQGSKNVSGFLSIFRMILLVFAGISLFVGIFIIANTFSILVAQRTRELALLRALGASRKQVTRSVVGEGAAVGFVGATVAIGVGILVAIGLRGLLSAFGIELPSGGVVVKPRTVVVAYLVGITVTVVSSLWPALRAGRVPPVAAMRDDVALPERSLRLRAIVGGVGAALGVLLVSLGLSSSAPLVGLGAVLLFLGAAALSPFIGRRVVSWLGSPIGGLGVATRLGRSNATRNPRRTAATASALMIGVALVSGATVFFGSLQKSVTAVFADSVSADVVIEPEGFQGFSSDVAPTVRKVEGVRFANAYRGDQAKVDGIVRSVQGADPLGVDSSLRLHMERGSAGAMSQGQVLVSHDLAAAQHWHVGSVVPVEYTRTGKSTVVVGGVYTRNLVAGDLLWPMPLFDKSFGKGPVEIVTATAEPGVSAEALRDSVIKALVNHPTLKIRTTHDYVAQQRRDIDKVLGLVLTLLALAVLIAGFGIVNTLALSVVERTREIGLLRAVGAGRKQVKRMIRVEAVLIALYGALLGLILGAGLAALVVHSLAGSGIDQLSLAPSRLVLYVVLAGLVGTLAAVLPARRAARLDVLAAIGSE
ncbi:MAG: putative transport system permease protein [Frankiales bacterium]|nr:putative transport system permease protein [Frankiales bacterium]